MILFEGHNLETITFDELRDEITSRELTEGYFIDWKIDVPTKLGKYVASFANTHGGYLFIGVKENPTTKKAQAFPGVPFGPDLLERVRNMIVNTIHRPPYFRHFAVRGPTDDKCIVVIHIPESQFTPHIFSDGRIYVRQADGSDPIQITDRHSLDLLYEKQRTSREKVASRLRETLLHNFLLPSRESWNSPGQPFRVQVLLYPQFLDGVDAPVFIDDAWGEFVRTQCLPAGGNFRWTGNGLALVDPTGDTWRGAQWWMASQYTLLTQDGVFETSIQSDREPIHPNIATGTITRLLPKASNFYSRVKYEGDLKLEAHFLGTFGRRFVSGQFGDTTLACDRGHFVIRRDMKAGELNALAQDQNFITGIASELFRHAGGSR